MSKFQNISSVVLEGHSAKVVFDTEWDEYVVTLDNNHKGDYFTTDKEDALDTARAMVTCAIVYPKK